MGPTTRGGFGQEPEEKDDLQVQQSNIRRMETSHKTITLLRCKAVILGNSHVGKTALTQMFHSDGQLYPKNYVMTLGVDFCVKDIKIPNTNTGVELYIHDTSGQSVFNQGENGVTRYCENASVALFVYDISSHQSFQAVNKWVNALRSANEGRPIPGILIANKTDLREQGRVEVTAQDGMDFAQNNGLTYFECSALRNTDVRKPFEFIANAFYQKYQDAIQGLKRQNPKITPPLYNKI